MTHLPEANPDEGLLPYHQLKVEDFPVVHQDAAATFYVKPFITPHYQFSVQAGGLFYAYVSVWTVSSGFDKNHSWRNASFSDMKSALPFAQAFLDLTEIHARKLAALKTGELPRGSGSTADGALLDLSSRINVFLNQHYENLQAERNDFVKATNQGRDRKKVSEVGAAIRKRLDALSVPTLNPPVNSFGASPPPTPFATLSPAK